MTRDELIALSRDVANTHSLDPSLVCAVCHHESDNWNVWAVRYEPAFFTRYVEPIAGIGDTEKIMRSTSWGLMQLMGQVARELGFKGSYLSELLDPPTNLEWGCQKLKRCVDRANDTRTALLLWNGGANKNYPDLVLRHLTEYS
jgi:soluble lytic murein transglycosylase-like protein